VHQKQYANSELFYSKALVIYESKFGEDGEKSLNCKDALEDIRGLIYNSDKKGCCIIS
jgi:hypothetical protein